VKTKIHVAINHTDHRFVTHSEEFCDPWIKECRTKVMGEFPIY